MARMAIDDSFLRDTRVDRLGKLCGWSKYETRGRLLGVFALCYDRVSSVLDPVDIDIAADFDGFSKHLVSVELASESRGMVRIAGSEERIRYLQSRQETGRQGGVKSGEVRRSKNRRSPSTSPNVTFENFEASLNPPDPVPSPSPDLVPSPVPVPPPDQEDTEQKRPSAKRRPRSGSFSDLEKSAAMAVLRKLGDQTEVDYRGAEEHTRLIIGRYRSGCDELDLRKVIAYASRDEDQGGLGWLSNPKMRKHLKPETLFGPENIERYLDPARSWFKRSIGKELEPSPEYLAWLAAEQPQPLLTVVK